MSSTNFWNDQFTRPDPEKNPEFYHKIDLHPRQNDVAYHYHRSYNKPVYHDGKIDYSENSKKHSKKYLEKVEVLNALKQGNVDFVRSFIQKNGFLKPTADPETDINRYFVHRCHHDHEEQHGEKKKHDQATKEEEEKAEESDREEVELAEESESENFGMKLLLEATILGRAQIVVELLKIPNVATEERCEADGCTPLLIAAKHHDLETLKALLDHDAFKRVHRDAVVVQVEHSEGSFVRDLSNQHHHHNHHLQTQHEFLGFNALMFACHSFGIAKRFGAKKKDAALVKDGDDDDIENEETEHTQHDQSIIKSSSVGNNLLHRNHSAFILDSLLQHDVDQEKEQEETEEEKSKELQQRLALENQVACIQQILMHGGFHINSCSADDRTALFIAAGHCAEPKVIQVLIRAGAGFSGAYDEEELGIPSHLVANNKFFNPKYHHVQIHPALSYDGGSFPVHQMILSGHLEHLKILIHEVKSLIPYLTVSGKKVSVVVENEDEEVKQTRRKRGELLRKELNLVYPQVSAQKLTPLLLACANKVSASSSTTSHKEDPDLLLVEDEKNVRDADDDVTRILHDPSNDDMISLRKQERRSSKMEEIYPHLLLSEKEEAEKKKQAEVPSPHFETVKSSKNFDERHHVHEQQQQHLKKHVAFSEEKQQGNNINQQNQQKETTTNDNPFAVSGMKKVHLEIVAELVRHGANMLEVGGLLGQLPVQVARSNKNNEIAKYLEMKMKEINSI